MNERLVVLVLAGIAFLGLWVAPWAATNRETGARSAVVLLTNRSIDFTGRTEPVDVPGQVPLLILGSICLIGLAGSTVLVGRTRQFLWLGFGVATIGLNAWGLNLFSQAVTEARIGAFVEVVEDRIKNPKGTTDILRLREIADRAYSVPLKYSLAEAKEAGLNVRRLPYKNGGMGLSAFLMFLAGSVSVFLSLRLSSQISGVIDRIITITAVPTMSILLALVVAAIVVLLLQPTPIGRSVEISSPYMYLVGRIDTLWHAYLTLFSDSLGTLSGFMEALKFSTPLIFTGLAVAFGFQAGLFNIGAPGQMIIGAIFAMLIGVYLPGPKILILPATVIAAAVGGGLWGALPGWLKARFGASEVINTILLNLVAAAFLLFILSSSPSFAASALRIIVFFALAGLFILALAIIPIIRKVFKKAPRAILGLVGVTLLIGTVLVGLPRVGDQVVVLNLPFKVAGSEPKSQEVREAARLPQLPEFFGIDVRETPGVNEVKINGALVIGIVVGLVILLIIKKMVTRMPWLFRFAISCFAGVLSFGVSAAFGLTKASIAIPPTNLNAAFLIAIASAVLMQYVLWRTKWGYELRAVGVSPEAAEYGGVSISRNTILAKTVSGAFAGLTACHYVLGGALNDFSLRQALPTGDGFDGIAVALLGGNSPLGIVLSAFLFGVLKNGGSVLNITFPGLTRDVVSMILALVVLFIAAKGFLLRKASKGLVQRSSSLGNAGRKSYQERSSGES